MREEMPEALADDVFVYAYGLTHCSVCAPAGMSPEIVVAKTNRSNPTGISSRWAMSDDAAFANGETNPCVCGEKVGRVHYLMVC